MKNVAASVRQRLLNLAHANNEDFQRVLTRYALERLLYRLGRSTYASQFIVKGAFLFNLWMPERMFHRATKDLDLLGYGSPDEERLHKIFSELCQVVSEEEDGLVLDPKTISCSPIRPQDKYSGIRVLLIGDLAKARIQLQVDVGFGDSILPPPSLEALPTLLPLPQPEIRVYQRETAIAEKFHAMVERGPVNSRMKDFFDIMVLARNFEFDANSLREALSRTFKIRGRDLPSSQLPIALTPDFASHRKRVEWKAFVKKSLAAEDKGLELLPIIEEVRGFLWPLCEHQQPGRWAPPGPWHFPETQN